jgi:HK97 family phage prohead protease
MRPTRERDFDATFASGNLKAYVKKDATGVERKYIGGTASSTAKDLYGDVFAASAQQEMVEKLRGLPMTDGRLMTSWLNHSYKIPEDTLGVIETASLVTRSENGVDFIDLDIEVRVTETNPRAQAAYDQISDGITHGWSVGLIFLEIDWATDDPDDWGFLVSSVDLLEISLVGMPANQRAWCRTAADLKAKAVETAERIVRDAKATKPVVREMVRKSLVDGTRSADAAAIVAELQKFTADELRAIGRKAAVAKLRELMERAGDEDGNATKLALKIAIDAIETRDGSDTMDDDTADALNVAIYEIGQAQSHGVCDAAGGHLAIARKGLEDLLPSNGDEDETDEGGDDESDDETETYAGLVATVRALPEAARTAVLAAVKQAGGEAPIIAALAADTTSAREQLAQVTADLRARSADLERMTSEIATRTTEQTVVETKLTELRAEQATLEAKLVDLRATPVGRRSVTAHGAARGADEPYEMRSTSSEDASKRLRQKLADRGATDPNPTLRPA